MAIKDVKKALSPAPKFEVAKAEAVNEQIQNCLKSGGEWINGACVYNRKEEPQKPQEAPRVKPNIPETFTDPRTGRPSGVTLPNGNTYLGLSQDEVQQVVTGEQSKAPPEGTQLVGTAQNLAQQRAELSGQVGVTQPSPTTPTPGLVPGVSLEEASAVAVREAIPRALSVAGGAAVAGATAGALTGGTLSIPLAVGAAATGFVGSMSASLLGNMKSQRTDDTNAQQRVLDEGKQTLQDWATQAAADPTRRAYYLSQFNNQLQLIQDAHVQMIADTNADVAKFETAIPNLAEFNSFYSVGGERDALLAEMQRSINGQVGDLEINFRMIELANRQSPQKTTSNENTGGFLGSLIP